jgi:hypothetical protein
MSKTLARRIYLGVGVFRPKKALTNTYWTFMESFKERSSRPWIKIGTPLLRIRTVGRLTEVYFHGAPAAESDLVATIDISNH